MGTRVYATIALAVTALACATSPLNDAVSAKVESYGGYTVYGALPTHRYRADQIPCKLNARLGTHFFLTVPDGEQGRFSIVTTWTRKSLEAPADARPEYLGREVRRFKAPFKDRTGTFLILTLNEKSDLFPAHYEQVVSSGSGRVLFKHQFSVPSC